MNDRIPLDKAYVQKRVAIDPHTECWIWQRSINRATGYGQLGHAPYTAHRLAYQLWNGEISTPVLRHTCHNRACCNPDHIIPGTHRDNYWDSREVQRLSDMARRGLPAGNRIAVTVNGVEFPSKAAAMKILHVGPITLERLIEPPRRDSNPRPCG